MSRQSSRQRRTEKLALRLAEVQERYDELCTMVSECNDDRCFCHEREWIELREIAAVLGVSVPLGRWGRVR